MNSNYYKDVFKPHKGSIAKKLLTIMIPLLIAIITVLIFTSMYILKREIRTNVESQMQTEAVSNAKTIENWSDKTLQALNDFKTIYQNEDISSDADQLSFLKQSINLTKSLDSGVYVADSDNNCCFANEWKPAADWVATERDWYKDGLKNDSFAYGAPYLDSQTNAIIVSATSKVDKSGTNGEVMAADISLKSITDVVSKITVLNSDSGYAFLVDKNTGMILANKNSKLNGLLLSDQTDSIMKQSAETIGQVKDYNATQLYDGKDRYEVSYEPVSGTSWILVSCVLYKELFKDFYSATTFSIMLEVIAVIIVSILLIVIITRLLAPVKDLTDNVSTISNGDFTVAITPRGNDEITIMSRSLSDYVEKMREMISDIRSVATNLNDESVKGKNVAEELTDTASTQSQSMNDMKQAIEQLAAAVTDVAENATELAHFVDNTNNEAHQANDKMHSTVEATSKGAQDMSNVMNNMSSIETNVNELVTVVQSVGNSMSEVNNIIGLISDISNQTNLLSLNASIEAARAGEAGKGFAVVATEIGHLAEDSRKSTEKIEKIIGDVNSRIQNMVDKTNESVGAIKENSESINTAYETFNDINSSINESNDLIASILKDIEKVNDISTNMAAISEEQSASAEEITATINNLAEQSQKLADNSKVVSNTSGVVSASSTELSGQLDFFKL